MMARLCLIEAQLSVICFILQKEKAMQKLMRLLTVILLITNCFYMEAADHKNELGRAIQGGQVEQSSRQRVKSATLVTAKNVSSADLSREDVVSMYNDQYLTTLNPSIDWSGNIGSCQPGITNSAYIDATLQMINYFRAMVGLPGVQLDGALNAKAQEAALMMIAEASLSHSPTTSWACYTADGAEAAGKSNLALGNHGPRAIIAYIRDSGGGNTAVGHRRWILYPRQTSMGTGSTDARNGNFPGSNALWVISSFGSRPSNPEWIAWPPQGYVPYQVVLSPMVGSVK